MEAKGLRDRVHPMWIIQSRREDRWWELFTGSSRTDDDAETTVQDGPAPIDDLRDKGFSPTTGTYDTGRATRSSSAFFSSVRIVDGVDARLKEEASSISVDTKAPV